MLILDEADQLLSKATLPHKIIEMSHKFMNDPVRILVKGDELTLEGIKQYFVSLEREECKLDILCDTNDTINVTHSVVFCNTKEKVAWLCAKLKESNFTVSLGAFAFSVCK